jgi:hypothetical protein
MPSFKSISSITDMIIAFEMFSLQQTPFSVHGEYLSLTICEIFYFIVLPKAMR